MFCQNLILTQNISAEFIMIFKTVCSELQSKNSFAAK